MSAAGWILPTLLIVPLLAALSSAASRRLARLLVLPVSLLTVGLAAAVCWDILHASPRTYLIGGWGAPLGIRLYADGLSALLMLMTALVGSIISLYAVSYFGSTGNTRAAASYWPLWWLLLAAMNGIYLAADIFNIYVMLELLGLAAVGFVIIGGTAAAIEAGLRYLLVALFGSLLYLLAVALLYGAYGTLDMSALSQMVAPSPHVAAALALMTVGLLIKSALFPLHFWLPAAHGSAITPVSAVLSALVVKASFYLILRLWSELFGATVPPLAAYTLGALGAAGVLWGALAALRQRKLKLLVAYSTVAQLGYLFLVFPLAIHVDAPQGAGAWNGGVYYALSHAFAKAAMFLAAGTIVYAWGEDDIDHLEGTSARLPVSLFAFALAGVSLMGLPPSGGFIAKWMLLTNAFAAGQWGWIAVLLIGGLLTAIYVFRVLRSAFVPPLPERALRAVPLTMQVAALTLALISWVLGFVAMWPLKLLAISGLTESLS